MAKTTFSFSAAV